MEKQESKIKEAIITHKGVEFPMLGVVGDTVYSAKWLVEKDFYEVSLLEWSKRMYERFDMKGVIVDAGAHFGNHTVYFGELISPPKVISFEPFKESFEILKRNCGMSCRKYKNYDLRNIGLWNEPCFLANKGDLRGAQAEFEVCQEPTDLEGDTLDNQLKDEEDISIMKVDTEAAEFEVLEGGLATITKHRPIIHLEAAHGVLSRHYLERFFDKYKLEYVDVGNVKRGGFPMHAFVPVELTK